MSKLHLAGPHGTGTGIYILSMLVLSVSTVASFHPALLSDGWPYNHEGLTWAYRSDLYAAAFTRGEWLPFWDASANFGLGSPMPLVYHKLYYLLAGLLQFIGLADKASAIVSLCFFALVGSSGVFAIGGQLQLSSTHRLVIAATFPHLNYLATDWLVRGAFAEFSAVCLIPWLIWWCITLLTTTRVSWSISLILTLTLLAHSVIALFSLIPLAVAFVVAFGVGKDCRPALLRQLTASILLFAFMALPLVFLIFGVTEYFDVSHITSVPTSHQFQPFGRYFYDPDYKWGEDWFTYTVQIDLPLTLGITALSLVWLIHFFSSPSAKHSVATESKNIPSAHVWWFLASTLSLFFWMQHPSSTIFYEQVPGANLIQFPWRLLGYISVLLLVVLMMLLHSLEDLRHGVTLNWRSTDLHLTKIFGITTLRLISAAIIILSLVRSIDYGSHKKSCLATPSAAVWPEYFPRMPDDSSTEEKKWALFDLADRGPEAPTCSDFSAERLASSSHMDQHFLTYCTQATTVKLPVAYSSIESVSVRGGDVWRRTPHMRTDDDPRIAVNVGKGLNHIRVALPSSKNLWGDFYKFERNDGSTLTPLATSTNNSQRGSFGGDPLAFPPTSDSTYKQYDASLLTKILQPFLRDRFVVLLATHDDNDLILIRPLAEQLVKVGSGFETENYRGAYAAIFVDGALTNEDTGLCRGAEVRKILNSHRVRAFAGINHALIEINGKDLSLNQPGINVLVWNTGEGIAQRLLFN